MAVYLATDNYDHNPDRKTISATTFIKSIKQIILGTRIDEDTVSEDISNKIKSQGGTALHTAVEQAWLTNHEKGMLSLGYPQHIIDRVRVNPTEEELNDPSVKVIPIYMERRSTKTVGSITISGKFDFVCEGKLEDIKRTSTYSYIHKTNDKAYVRQGSIYKWLNQDIITGDSITIQYEFSDWSAHSVKQKNYPPHMQMPYKLPLMSVAETNSYITNKVAQLEQCWNLPEEDLPACNSEELWQTNSVWKYYKNPGKSMKRSTANFATSMEANARLALDNNVGLVVEVKGKARACAYCKAFSICKQKDNYLNQ